MVDPLSKAPTSIKLGCFASSEHEIILANLTWSGPRRGRGTRKERPQKPNPSTAPTPLPHFPPQQIITDPGNEKGLKSPDLGKSVIPTNYKCPNNYPLMPGTQRDKLGGVFKNQSTGSRENNKIK